MPKKELNGSDVAEFIKERQRGAVRTLDRPPKLLIVSTNASPVTDLYLKIKQEYASDIGAQVVVCSTTSASVLDAILVANKDDSIDGIIVQLPLDTPELTSKVLNSVAPDKDVDGLADDSDFDPATPTAILWLLSSYNIGLEGKKVLVIGQGRLVGAPLSNMLVASGVEVVVADETTDDLRSLTMTADIIICATGQPRMLTSEMVPADAVIVDAGSATDNGLVVGDVDDDVRQRTDVIITPKKGGVGPLTVAALFDNLIRAARPTAE